MPLPRTQQRDHREGRRHDRCCLEQRSDPHKQKKHSNKRNAGTWKGGSKPGQSFYASRHCCSSANLDKRRQKINNKYIASTTSIAIKPLVLRGSKENSFKIKIIKNNERDIFTQALSLSFFKIFNLGCKSVGGEGIPPSMSLKVFFHKQTNLKDQRMSPHLHPFE